MTKQIRNLIGAALLLAAVSASAQSAQTIKVKVPFPFVTAGKSWPAAEYRLEVTTEDGILTLSSPGIGPAMMLTTHNERLGGRNPHLRFECSGDHWVLQEVTLEDTMLALPLGESTEEPTTLNPSCQGTFVASGSTSR